MKTTHLLLWLGAALAGYSSVTIAAGGYIEAREAYNTASDKHELALRAGYGFENGAGIMYTNAYSTQHWDEFKTSYNELEGWHPLYKITPAITLQLGGLINSSKDGSGGAAYGDVNYKFTPDFNVTARYRYNHKNYDTPNLLGENDKNDVHQFIMYWNYRINPTWSYTFEPDYYIVVNDYHQKNGRDHSWELNNKLTWNYTTHWKPYLELSWLDRWVDYSKEQYRIRLGMRYYF